MARPTAAGVLRRRSNNRYESCIFQRDDSSNSLTSDDHCIPMNPCIHTYKINEDAYQGRRTSFFKANSRRVVLLVLDISSASQVRPNFFVPSCREKKKKKSESSIIVIPAYQWRMNSSCELLCIALGSSASRGPLESSNLSSFKSQS